MKNYRSNQISEHRQSSDSFSLDPAFSQTKSCSAFSVRSASPNTDAHDEANTAVVMDILGDDSHERADDVFDIGEDKTVTAVAVNNMGDDSKEDDDDVFDIEEDDYQLSRQITKEEICEHGPAQIMVSQALRISSLEERLEKAHEDSKYLEALLEIRNADFARYCDLHWSEKIKGEHLAEMVDALEADMEEKDQLINSMQANLDCLLEAERTGQELIAQQKQLTKSTLALLSRQRKTKLASPHSVQYTVTSPRPPVQEEIAMAEKREWERRKEEQRKDIVVMVNHVDRIAASFDRYQNTSTIITLSEPRSDVIPDHLFTWMEEAMIALWLFSVEPTMEEQEKYEKHLEKQSRPDPIYSPNLPKARVNWNRLNPNTKKNLPLPDQYPVYGCANDPEFYTTLAPARYYLGQKMDPSLVFEDGRPFGSLYGFWTSKGVLAPPDEPVGGYHCCLETGTWIIAAEGG